jgi:photosystem II stability/assembly factor-like uncharacterized protein
MQFKKIILFVVCLLVLYFNISVVSAGFEYIGNDTQLKISDSIFSCDTIYGSMTELSNGGLALAYLDSNNNKVTIAISNDNGNTWNKHIIDDSSASYLNYRYLSLIELDNGTLAVAYSDGDGGYIAFSNDNGITWTKKYFDYAPSRIELIQLSNGKLAISYTDTDEGWEGAFRISDDGGDTWNETLYNDNKIGKGLDMIELSNENIVITYGDYSYPGYWHIFISNDEGKTFTKKTFYSKYPGSNRKQQIARIVELKNGNLAIAYIDDGGNVEINEGYVAISNNSGDTWSHYPFNSQKTSLYLDMIQLDSGELVISFSDVDNNNYGTLAISDDNGHTWDKHIFKYSEVGYTNIMELDNGNLAITYEDTNLNNFNMIIVSSEWELLDIPNSYIDIKQNYNGQYQVMTSPGGNGGKIHVSSDFGETWVYTSPADKNYITSGVDMNSKGDIVVVSHFLDTNALMLSYDYGNTWNNVYPIDNNTHQWTDVAINELGEIIITGELNGNVYISYNKGKDWSVIDFGLINSDYDFDMDATGKNIVVSTGKRIFISNNSGLNWNEIQPYGDMDKNWIDIHISKNANKIFMMDDNHKYFIYNYYFENKNMNWFEAENQTLRRYEIVNSVNYSSNNAVKLQDTGYIKTPIDSFSGEYYVYVLYKGDKNIKRELRTSYFSYQTEVFSSNHNSLYWASLGSVNINNHDYLDLYAEPSTGSELIVDKILLTEEELNVDILNELKGELWYNDTLDNSSNVPTSPLLLGNTFIDVDDNINNIIISSYGKKSYVSNDGGYNWDKLPVYDDIDKPWISTSMSGNANYMYAAIYDSVLYLYRKKSEINDYINYLPNNTYMNNTLYLNTEPTDIYDGYNYQIYNLNDGWTINLNTSEYNTTINDSRDVLEITSYPFNEEYINGTSVPGGQGNESFGFYGEVTTDELFGVGYDNGDLQDELGFIDGTTQYNDSSWLKFNYEGLVEYVSKKTIRYNISWYDIYDVLTENNSHITINNITYNVRLIDCINTDTTGAYEWFNTIRAVHETFTVWYDYNNTELIVGDVGNGRATWCSNTHSSDDTLAWSAGYNSVSHLTAIKKDMLSGVDNTNEHGLRLVLQPIEQINTSTNLKTYIPIKNAIPTQPDISVTSSLLYTDDTLSVIGSNSTDFEMDELVYYYKFYNVNDSTIVQEYSTNNTYISNINDTSDIIRIYVKTYDGLDYSDENYVDKYINSHPPVIEDIDITGTLQGLDVSGSCNVSDYENDDVRILYYWYANDVLIINGELSYQNVGYIDVPNLNTSSLYVGDNITLDCAAVDEYSSSVMVSSDGYILGNRELVGYSDFQDDTTIETEIGDEIEFSGTVELYNNVDICVLYLMSNNTEDVIDALTITTTSGTTITFDDSFVLTSDYGLENNDVKWRVLCNDSQGNYEYSDYEYFTVYDYVNPEIDVPSIFIDNDFVIDNVFNGEFEINVTFSDYNLFHAGIEIECEEDGNIYSWEYTDIGAQSYTYVDNVDITGYNAQKCNITFISTDDHTVNEIPEYEYVIDNNTLMYRTENGANVAIQSVSDTNKISTDKLVDRYNFNFDYDESSFIRQYLITTDMELYYRGNNSIYPGHFVVWNPNTQKGNWIDFALPNSDDFYYIINKINEKSYEIILIHKVLMVDNIEEYNFKRNEIDNIFQSFINLFKSEVPLNDNEIKQTDIEYIEQYELMDYNDIINTYNLQVDRQNNDELLKYYGINDIKFNSLGGTNSLNVTYDFDIAGVFNLTTYDLTDEINFTNYSIYVENIDDDSIFYNGTFNVSSNNYITNVTNGNYLLEFTHPYYITKSYTKSMPEDDNNLVDVLYNTSETWVTFSYQNIKSYDYINNYTIYINNTNTSTVDTVNVEDESVSLPLYANIDYNVTFVKDGYINTTFNYMFDYGEEINITENIGYYINISYLYEHNYEQFDFNDTYSSYLKIHCDDSTISYDLVNDSTSLITVTCDYEKFVVSTAYLSEVGVVDLYRKVVTNYEESLDLTIYLIDGVETPYTYSRFSLDDLMGRYENPLVIVKKKIDIGTVNIHSEQVGPSSEMGVFLIENDEYIIEIHSDNLPVRIIGSYNADVGETKSISLYDVNFGSSTTGFYDNVKFRIEKVNYSGVDNAVFEYSDILNQTNSIQFKLYLGSLNGTVIYESEMFNNINEIGPLMVPLTAYENDTIVGQIYINHEDNGILTPSKILNKTWNILLRIKEHVGQNFLNWFFILLLSSIALYTSKDINIASLVLVMFAFIFTLFRWFTIGYGIIGLVFLISLIDFLVGGKK